MVVHGDDLVIATHGRSFWILDDITALRQMKATFEKAEAVLYSPATAVRVDNDWFLGTPVPPEEPAATNPPSGAIVDYYLSDSARQIKLEIFDGKGNLIRGFSSDEKKTGKRPPMAIADRWFPQPQVLDTKPGMHRFVWDLAAGKPPDNSETSENDEEYGSPRGPRVPPGSYEARLTVDGKTFTQPLKVIMDPRVVVTAKELQEQYQLGQQLFAETIRCRKALAEIHSVQKRLTAAVEKDGGLDSEIKASVAAIQEAISKILKGGGVHAGDGMGLESACDGEGAALRVVESSDRTIPSQALAVYEESKRAAKLRLDEWSQVKSGRLAGLNEQLKKANEATVPIGD
jgi:hypothetical protein